MGFKQIVAILAIVVQVANAVLAAGAGLIPAKYATVIATVVGLIQGFLPRAQGSDASDVDVKAALLLFFVGSFLLLGGTSAQAQTKSNEVSFVATVTRQNPHFTRSDFKYNQSTDQAGADVSLTHYFGKSAFGVTFDAGVSAKGRAATDASLVTAVLGPTIKARNLKLSPFVRVLIGGARLAARNQQLKFDKTNLGLAVIAGGGVDWNVSNRFAVRVIQADFLGTRILGSTVKNARVGAGVVFRF